MKIGYAFVCGCPDGYKELVTNEGVYLNYKSAFQHLIELNEPLGLDFIYEEGYGEDYYPDDDFVCTVLEEAEDWEGLSKEIESHRLTDISAICNRIMDMDIIPYGAYAIEEIEIHE